MSPVAHHISPGQAIKDGWFEEISNMKFALMQQPSHMCIHCIFCKYFFSSNTFVRDNHENDSDEGPPFKSRPKPSNRGCNELERMIIAERRKNRNNPRLKCDPRMRRVAVAHAKNQIRHRFDPMPDRVRPPNLKKIRYILTLFQSYTLLI